MIAPRPIFVLALICALCGGSIAPLMAQTAPDRSKPPQLGAAPQLADAIEFLGADLTTTSSFDASAVRLNVPVARLQDALPIMADVALRPTFPEADLNR